MHSLKDKLIAAGHISAIEASLSGLTLKQLIVRRNKAIQIAVYSDITEQEELLALNTAIRRLRS